MNKQAKTKHKVPDADMRNLFNQSPHIVVLFDLNYDVIDCNPVALEFMKFDTLEEMILGFKERIVDSIPPYQSDGRHSIPIYERFQTAKTEGHCEFDTEIVMNGNMRTLKVELKKLPFKGDYAIAGYIVDITDINDQRKELIKTRENNELQLSKLNLMVQATNIGLWEMEVLSSDPTSPKNKYAFSDNFRHMLGYTSEADFPNVLESWSNLLHPDDKENTINSFKEHILDKTGETPYDVEYRLMCKDGTYAFFHAHGATTRNSQGSPLRIVGSLMDVTKTKQMTLKLEENKKKLEEALKQAEIANKAKSLFLKTISHEIRTPMNSILGTTEIQLQSEKHSMETLDAFKRIYSSGDLLLGIINDILDLSKIEAGKLELGRESYDVASLINNSAHLNVMHIMSKPIEFELNVDENIPTKLIGDELRVKQILNNLLSNAFKYTSKGKIILAVHTEESSESGESNEYNESGASRVVDLIITVADTGQGMTTDQLDKLFDEYTRFNVDSNRTIEGTGLGMSIVNKLVSLMNGKIDVTSVINEGTVFTVRFPQKVAGTSVLGSKVSENLKYFRMNADAYMKRVQVTREPMPYGSVLIVDDVEANIYVASGLMVPYGLKIDSADSGFDAIEKVKAGNIYDIIFMDHMMPKMDGVETTKIIKDLGYKHPIVALTANAVVGQSEMFLNNGFCDFIAKPIDIRQLNTVLNRLIRDKQPPEVLQAARLEDKCRKDKQTETLQKKAIEPRLIAAFLHDSIRSITLLESIIKKNPNFSQDDITEYATSVHGMKSALSSISHSELSAIAYELEMYAKEIPPKINVTKTAVFINSMKSLIAELKSTHKPINITPEEEDKTFLQKQLRIIKTASEAGNAKRADNAVSHLLMKSWSKETNALISKVSDLLLKENFDEIVEVLNKC